jgi:hypothetical protein
VHVVQTSQKLLCLVESASIVFYTGTEKRTHVLNRVGRRVLPEEGSDGSVWHPLANEANRKELGNSEETNNVRMSKATPGDNFASECLPAEYQL